MRGHADVHQHDVRPIAACSSHGLSPIGCLGHHLDLRVRPQDQREAGPDQLLVIRHHDRDHRSPPSISAASARAGMCASTWNPPSTPAPVSAARRTRPPARASRSGRGRRRRRPPAARDRCRRRPPATHRPRTDEDDRRPCGRCVLETVRQGLLDDPVGDQLHTLRQRLRRTSDRQGHREPGGFLNLGDEIRYVGQSRHRLPGK